VTESARYDRQGERIDDIAELRSARLLRERRLQELAAFLVDLGPYFLVDRHIEISLGAEIHVDGTERHTGTRGDVAQRCAVVTVLREASNRAFEQHIDGFYFRHDFPPP